MATDERERIKAEAQRRPVEVTNPINGLRFAIRLKEQFGEYYVKLNNQRKYTHCAYVDQWLDSLEVATNGD